MTRVRGAWLLCLLLLLYGALHFVSLDVISDVSMAPTIPDSGVVLFVRSDAPRRGDIIITRLPAGLIARHPKLAHRTTTLCKRVTHISGDQVVWQGKTLILGPDEFWLQGDNEAASIDSRYFGPIRRGELLGLAFPLTLFRR
ncbi:S26 family signal peptidase [Anthocerotibacter panamensis]|uniref:S26 family signal peptidase n=1 Tax=Anthocerotibacter panamensis TaxID=2857077 RepID=UPI001C403630